MRSVILAGLATLLFAVRAAAQPLDAEDRAAIAAIETALPPGIVVKGRPAATKTLAQAMAETHTPGVSLAFFEDGKVKWTRTYGYADVAAKRPVTPQTLFQAASISKPVTATAALRLVEQGRLDLDQDVTLHLKAWTPPESPFTAERKITLRGLLSHTAGLTVHGFPGYPPGAALPSVVQILNGQAPANTGAVVSDARPGERWSYSGGGYVVAQLLMTEATGRPFPDLMRELVLAPAGMTNSAYDQPLSTARAPLAARGYFATGEAMPGPWFTYPELAPAGLWTTPSDLARFAIALQDSYRGASSRVLKPATARMMMTRGLGDFGLGVSLQPVEGPPTFEHGGSNQGYQSELRAFLTGRRQGVAIMTNGDGGQALLPLIVRAVAQTYGWSALAPQEKTVVAVPAERLAALAGVYEIAGSLKATVSAQDGRLYLTAPVIAAKPTELLAESPSRFFTVASGVVLSFEPEGGVVAQTPYGTFKGRRVP